jgi:hypothetical protein
MRTRVGVLLGILTLSVCLYMPAAAASKVSDIPQDEVCTRVGNEDVLHEGRFLRWLLNDHGVSLQCIDSDNDGEQTTAERKRLITSERPNCKRQDQDAVLLARDFVDAMLRYGKERFEVRPEKNHSGPFLVEGLFGTPATLTLKCLAAQKKKPDSSQVPKPFKLSETEVAGWKLKLRGDQGSLQYDRVADKDDYKSKAKSAEISFTDDALKDKTTYNLTAAVGLDSGPIRDPANYAAYRFIPYVKMDYTHVTPLKKGESDVNKVAYGLLGSAYFEPKNSFIHSKLSFDPQFVTDVEGKSRLFGSTIALDPTLIFDGWTFPGGKIPVAGLFYYQFDVAALVRIGRVLESGGSASLEHTNNFIFWGSSWDLVLKGHQKSVLSPAKLTFHYHSLQGEGALFDRVEQFTSKLALELTDDGNVDVSVSYDTGRDYEKFDKRRLWKAALGYKF